MKVALALGCAFLLVQTSSRTLAENTVIAEDDASDPAYDKAWDNSKNGGSGFSSWTLTTDGTGNGRFAGFFIASIKDNPDCKGIAKGNKAFGLYANGSGFEQAVAGRFFEKPLQPGDSFSFMLRNGRFEKKFDEDDSTPGSIGITLRSGTGDSSIADYNKNALFEFGYYPGKPNYQIIDGSGEDKADSGIPLDAAGISVTVSIIGPDSYDLEIQTLSDKSVTKLPGRKFTAVGPVRSFAIFDRNGEKNDVFFNQFQVTRESK